MTLQERAKNLLHAFGRPHGRDSADRRIVMDDLHNLAKGHNRASALTRSLLQ